MHFCHAYTVLNRFDTSGLEGRSPSKVLTYKVVLPDINNLHQILDDFKVLVSRLAIWYTTSSLIGKFNMNTMKTCLRSLQWYVVDFTSSQQVHPCREYRSISGGQWNSTCAAGNKSVALSDIWGQLTLARLRGAIALRCFHKTSLAHFDRYVTATSDWHASLCPVTVILYTIFNYAY